MEDCNNVFVILHEYVNIYVCAALTKLGDRSLLGEYTVRECGLPIGRNAQYCAS